jgi:hypothetical protein
MYVNNRILLRELKQHGARVTTHLKAAGLTRQWLSGSDTILGFSGYATAGYNYTAEADGMQAVFEYFHNARKRLALVTDGGVSAGVVGLSGVLGRMWNVPTLGFLPLKGLAEMGSRDHMIVWGNTFRDRERLVGTMPDILVCVGGSDGSMRECLEALKMDIVVVLLILKDYDPTSFPGTFSKMRKFSSPPRKGQVLACRSVDDIAECLRLALLTSEELRTRSRRVRYRLMQRLLMQTD